MTNTNSHFLVYLETGSVVPLRKTHGDQNFQNFIVAVLTKQKQVSPVKTSPLEEKPQKVSSDRSRQMSVYISPLLNHILQPATDEAPRILKTLGS